MARADKSHWMLTELNRLNKTMFAIQENIRKVTADLADIDVSIREHDSRVRMKFEKDMEELEMYRAGAASAALAPDISLQKAKSVVILADILGAIESWSTDPLDQATDFTTLSQSVLFPCVWDRIMGGVKAYYFEDVPVAAGEVVRQGREMVKHYRSTLQVGLDSPQGWSFQNEVKDWWLNVALPLLYGSRDDRWDDDDCYTYEQMDTWKRKPYDALLQFPRIRDAYDLMKARSEEAYDATTLCRFGGAV